MFFVLAVLGSGASRVYCVMPAAGFPGGAARHFSANYMPFAGAEIFVREHACVRAEKFFGHFLICGAEF